MALLHGKLNGIVLNLLSLVLVMPALILYILIVRTERRHKQLPPAPVSFPVIGNLHMLGDAVYRSLKDLSDKHGPVMSLQLGSVKALVISSSEAAELVFKTHDHAFSSRPSLAVGKHLLFDNQDMIFSQEWMYLKKITTTELMTAKKVESHRHVREEEAAAMLSNIWCLSQCGNVPVDLSHVFYCSCFNILWRMLAGKAFPEKMMELKYILDEVNLTLGSVYIGDFIPWLGWLDCGRLKRRMIEARRAFDRFLEENVFEHEERGSFIDFLLKESHKDAVLSGDCIKAVILDMFATSTETIGATLEWTMSLLVKHPHCVLRLQREIEEVVGDKREVDEKDLAKMRYLQSVVKESMRLYPVAPLSLPHECSRKVELRMGDGHCYKVERGTRLITNLWAIGRDPAVWENAEEFHPERFMMEGDIDIGGLSNMKSIPFGAGRRVCGGVDMTIPSVLLIIARLFHAFDWTVDGEARNIDMSEKMTAIIHRRDRLFATPTLRKGTCFPNKS